MSSWIYALIGAGAIIVLFLLWVRLTAVLKPPKKRNTPKKRLEFSQKIIVLSWALTAAWITASFVLSFLDKDTNATVTVALISESFGVTLSYMIYQAMIKSSLNKNGLVMGKDGIPRRLAEKLSEFMGDENGGI